MKTMIAYLAVQALLVGSAFAQPGPPPSVPPSNPNPQAPAPGNPSAPSAPARPAIGGLELRAALCQIDGILSPMDGVPVPAGEASLCPPPFSIENVPAYIAAGDRLLKYAELGRALVAYYEFRALAFGPDQCAPLSSLQAVAEKTAKMPLTGGGKGWEFNCRTEYRDIRLAQALIMHDPQAASLCPEQDSPDSNPNKKHDEASALCRRAAAASDLKAFGQSACRGGSEGMKNCADFFRALSGDGSVCRSSEGVASGIGGQPRLCRGYVAFAKAGPAKNAALCGDDDVCLAMTGAAVRAAVNAQREVAVNLGPALLPIAEAKLKALASQVDPMNEAQARELDDRAQRIASLRLKSDPTSRKRAPRRKRGASDAPK